MVWWCKWISLESPHLKPSAPLHHHLWEVTSCVPSCLFPCAPCIIHHTKRVLPMESLSFFPCAPFAWIPVWLSTCVNSPSSSDRTRAISKGPLPALWISCHTLSLPPLNIFLQSPGLLVQTVCCMLLLFIYESADRLPENLSSQRTKGARLRWASHLGKKGIQHRIDTQVTVKWMALARVS